MCKELWSARAWALVLAASPGLACAELDLTTTLTLNGVGASANVDQQFPGEKTEQYRQWLSTRGHLGPLALQLTYANRQIQEFDSEGDLVVEEFVLEKNTGDWDFSLGVKRLDWGVGYGFRPLSIFDRSDRLSLVSTINVGPAIASVSKFGATDEWTLLCAAESENPYENEFRSDLRCAGRLFALVGDWDLQAVVSQRSDIGMTFGASFSTVMGDSTEFHGSAHVQERKLAIPGLPGDGNDGRSATQALLGVTYTTDENLAWIAEVWRDETVKTSIGEPEDYVMVRLAYTDDKAEPSITAVHTPEDDGLALTLGVKTSWSSGAELSLGLREYAGPDDAFYTKLPDSRQFFAEFSVSF
ncbi:MAG: hypothetical protein ACPGSC_12605 [Granulosicoccaceae bacterium]